MKDYTQQQYHLSKAQDRYFSICSEWESHLMIMYKEFGAAWEPCVGNKLYEKEQVISRRVDEVSNNITFKIILVLFSLSNITLNQSCCLLLFIVYCCLFC